MNPVGLEPTTSDLQVEEVTFELELIGVVI